MRITRPITARTTNRMADRNAGQRASHFTARIAARAALMAAVTAALAWVRVPLPFTAVPITGQSLGIMLAGLVLGAWGGALSAAVYVLLGALGLPVFAGGTAGPGVLLGPTGGYLWGFIAGAWVTGALAAPRQAPSQAASKAEVLRAVAACIAGGVLTVYLLGVLQLAAVTNLTLAQAIAAGALPFLPGDLVKALVAAVTGQRLVRALGSRELGPG